MLGDVIHADLEDMGIPLHMAGYRDLFAQVVLLAVMDALGQSRCCGEKKSVLKRRALNWINSPAVSAGSLHWYCSFIDVDAVELRRRVNLRCGLPADLREATDAVRGLAA